MLALTMRQGEAHDTAPSEPVASASRTRSVTPLQAILAGAAVLGVGAAAAGGSHYFSTAKQLAEDGVEAAARLQAVPVAVRLRLPCSSLRREAEAPAGRPLKPGPSA